MSLHVSFNDFQKMVDKECIKKTGLTLQDFPTVWCEDFWSGDLNETISIQDAKKAVEICLEACLATIRL